MRLAALLLPLALAGCTDVTTTRWVYAAGDCPSVSAPAPWPIATPEAAGLDASALEVLAVMSAIRPSGR